ncbi:MAG: PilN domain-containing protein [Candidatus Omnitrophica bacterium]|nr:PilN domain-containing protein [Candidatus Omnitrophota bacterium]
MIEINLLPKELKTKGKKIYTDPRYLLRLAPLVPVALVAIFIFINLYLATVNIAKNLQLSYFNNKWKRLGAQRKTLEDFRKKYDVLFSADSKIIQKLVAQKISWPEKLNKLSLSLPSGIWFNELSFKEKSFVLKGSAVSLQKEEMNLINKFIDNLKKDKVFFKDFITLELSSVQRKVIAGYDILDFILNGTTK